MRINFAVLIGLIFLSYSCQKDTSVPCSNGLMGQLCREELFIGNRLFRATSYHYYSDNYFVKSIRNAKGNMIGKEEVSVKDAQIVKRVIIDDNGTITLTQNLRHENEVLVEINSETRMQSTTELWDYSNGLLLNKKVLVDEQLVKVEQTEYLINDTLKLRTLFFDSQEVLDSTYEFQWYGDNLYRVDKFNREGLSMGYELSFFDPDGTIMKRTISDSNGKVVHHYFEYDNAVLVEHSVLNNDSIQLSRTNYIYP